jgi:Rrf2 family protein
LISQTAEYGLRAVVALAEESKPLVTEQLAEIAQVPLAYLYKVLQQLSRSGVVRSQRGLHGGYRLAASPEKVTLLEVLKAVDPPRRIHECPLDLEEHQEMLCPLHKRIDDALASVEKVFAKTTIAELLKNRRRPRPLCGMRRKSKWK